MDAATWINLLAICVTIVLAVAGASIYIGRLIGSLPGLISEAIRTHERSCSAYDPHTSPRLRAVGGDDR